jgi:protein-tyrosine phosphatase
MPEEPQRRVRLLFVCLGNICRSPTAEGVMRALVAEAGLQESIQIDSAGTGSWHVGGAPDERATDAARARGLVLEGAARQVGPADLEHFDLVLAMDLENASELRTLAQDEEQRAKVRLLREFDPQSGAQLDVPDPYYGGAGGFDEVLDLVQAACAGLLEEIRAGRVP